MDSVWIQGKCLWSSFCCPLASAIWKRVRDETSAGLFTRRGWNIKAAVLHPLFIETGRRWCAKTNSIYRIKSCWYMEDIMPWKAVLLASKEAANKKTLPIFIKSCFADDSSNSLFCFYQVVQAYLDAWKPKTVKIVSKSKIPPHSK